MHLWIYEAFPHLGRYVDKSLDSPLPIPHLLRWHTLKCDNIMEGDPFKYKENNTKMEQRYMKIFKPYTKEVKDTSIDALKVQIKGVTVITSLAEVADEDEDEDLGGHHYVPSPPRACDHASSSGIKTSPDASNDDDLHERIALLEKSLLDITSFVRDERLRRIEKNKKKQQEEVHLDSPPCSRNQVNLEELAVAVTNMTAVDEKGEEEKKEEEMEEENAVDAKEEEKEKEKEKHEEMTAEAEEENEKKTKEDGEKKSEEEEDKDEKGVEEELMVEQEVENIKEEKQSSSEEEVDKENKKNEVEEEKKKHEEKEVDVMGIVAELNQEN
ncbi:hypothetical protein P3L10_025967 [Capsicum annuum]